MRRALLVSLALCLAATLAAAQTQPPPAQPTSTNNVAHLFFTKIKPGTTQQYEQGRKQHMAWHKAQNDPWTWYTWEILTGDNTGGYVVGTFDHAWKDFDGREKFDVADSANAEQTMGNYIAGETSSYVARRVDLARDPSMPPQPAKYISVVHFMLKPEAYNDFVAAVKQANAAIVKTNYPAARAQWYAIANGGRGPHLVLVQDRNSLADMQGPEKTLDQVLQEAYGDQGAAIMKSLRSAYTFNYTELLQYRPDLSYVAGAAH